MTLAVPFNRALYAQLAQQQFQPPRGYPLPTPTNPTFKAADLGMKLTCGFEMLMARHDSGTGVLDTVIANGTNKTPIQYHPIEEHMLWPEQ